MTNVDAEVRRARGRLDVAQHRLLRDYPFHAQFLARWHLQAAKSIPTAGVTLRAGRILLFFNPEFVERCSLPELGGVLLHECHHVLFGHLTFDPRHFPDGNALLVAEEVTANEYIREPLPGSPILLKQYADLPAGEDTRTRYRRLAGYGAGENPCQLYQKTAFGVPNPSRRSAKECSSGPELEALRPLDDHTIWAEARDSRAIGELTVRVALEETAQALSADEWSRVPTSLRQLVRRRGTSPGNGIEFLEDVSDGILDWARLLRRYVRELADRQPTYAKPPRRFPELIGLVPSHRRGDLPARIATIIDTSASMASDELGMVAAELKQMSRTHSLTVIECDVRVRAIYRFAGSLEAVRGRGGTDLRPAFDRKMIAHLGADLIVCFTDGAAVVPECAPHVPVIWCLTPDGHKPAEWGREIWLPGKGPQ